MIVADTDVLIDALRGREPAQRRIALELPTGSLATTAITVFELLSGARNERSRREVERLLAAIAVLDFDEHAASAAAEIRRSLESRGEPIGMADYMIAGICRSRSAILLTGNRAHFERIPDLRLSLYRGG